jgi:hypothetical protein
LRDVGKDTDGDNAQAEEDARAVERSHLKANSAAKRRTLNKQKSAIWAQARAEAKLIRAQINALTPELNEALKAVDTLRYTEAVNHTKGTL